MLSSERPQSAMRKSLGGPWQERVTQLSSLQFIITGQVNLDTCSRIQSVGAGFLERTRFRIRKTAMIAPQL